MKTLYVNIVRSKKMFRKQCKGTDSDKLQMPVVYKTWYMSIKYDGHYMQVHVNNGLCRFYTSSGKEFYEKNLAEAFGKLPNGIYECEFLGKGTGKHGGRADAAIATTLRTEFSKGILSNYPGVKAVIFDIINDELFADRLKILNKLASEHPQLTFVAYQEIQGEDELYRYLNTVLDNGYEGLYLKQWAHRQFEGKRVKTAIKLKAKHTADLVCFDIEVGEGKYSNAIGSLVCKDENGIVVKVGSGLTDHDRNMRPDHYIGRTIEIAYESFKDTYIHPIYKGIRTDI